MLNMLENESRQRLQELLREFIATPIEETYAKAIEPYLKKIEKVQDKTVPMLNGVAEENKNKIIEAIEDVDEKVLKNLSAIASGQDETIRTIGLLTKQLLDVKNAMLEVIKTEETLILEGIQNVGSAQNEFRIQINSEIKLICERLAELEDNIKVLLAEKHDSYTQQQLILESKSINKIEQFEKNLIKDFDQHEKRQKFYVSILSIGLFGNLILSIAWFLK